MSNLYSIQHVKKNIVKTWFLYDFWTSNFEPSSWFKIIIKTQFQ
jgi:hypothetical protein